MPDTKSYGREEVLAKMGRGRNIPPTSRLGEELEFVGFYDALAYIDRLTIPEDTTQDTAPSGSVEEAQELLDRLAWEMSERGFCNIESEEHDLLTSVVAALATLRNALSQPPEREALLERLQREVVAVFDDAPELRDDFRVRGVVQVLDALSLLSPTAPTQARKEVE